MTAFDHGKRSLARPKALNLGGTSDAFELRLDFFFYIGDRNDQINTALQAGQNFNHGLH
jgi:hypothetical protein